MILVDTNIIIDFWDKPTDEVKNILEENDLKKAKTLIEKGRFAEIMNYMLEKNQKLEQEIIGWDEMWGKFMRICKKPKQNMENVI